MAHFPCLFVFIIPIIAVSKCQSTGASALSNREQLILNFQLLEYIGTWALFVKLIIGLQHNSSSKYNLIQHDQGRADNEEGLLKEESEITFFGDDAYTFMFVVLMMTVAFICQYHLMNEYFYRKFLGVWEDNIKENFHEQFSSAQKSRFCLQMKLLMRYLNFHEWIALWKVKGEIIPKEQALVRDNICFVFLQISKWQTTIQSMFKYTFLTFALAWSKFMVDPINLFKDPEFQQRANLAPGELSAY